MPFNITRADDLTRVCEQLPRMAGVMNPAAAFEDALTRRLQADAFVVFTADRGLHADPRFMAALENYRRVSGIPAKLVLIVPSARTFASAGVGDPLQLSVAGFDATVPAIIADFLRMEN
jgi:60 kDa SS-A/Ro ribonucleoprotein